MKPFLLKPCCKDYIWGGNRLRDFGKNSDSDRIAESWELSTHPDGESLIASGAFEGMTLTQFLKEHPEAAGWISQAFDPFPVMVKLIDARERLSVQVHPDKTELWYIIDAQPNASVFYGFRKALSRSEFRDAIDRHSLTMQMKRLPVKKGDVFMIPAGTLHAVGAGILLAEVQQNSNITYRVFDYNRGRELHIEQALEVTSLSPTENPPPKKWHRIPESSCSYRKLGRCRYFSAANFRINSPVNFHGEQSFIHLLVLEGCVSLKSCGENFSLPMGSSVFVPAETPFLLDGEGSVLTVQVKRA